MINQCWTPEAIYIVIMMFYPFLFVWCILLWLYLFLQEQPWYVIAVWYIGSNLVLYLILDLLITYFK